MTYSVLIKKLTGVTLSASIFFAGLSALPQAAEAKEIPVNATQQTDITDPIDAYAQQEGISTKEVFHRAAKELEASSLERNIDSTGSHYVYYFTDGSTLSFPTAAEFENRMSAGFDNGQIWLELTPLEQKMAVGGGLTGVGGALCFAGPAACAVGGAIAGALTFYVSERGVCPNNQRMTLYFARTGSLNWARCGSR